MRKMLCALLLALSGIGLMAQHAVRVTTANGILEGVDSAGVKIFKGIPYAQPPVGELRWKAPEPVASWEGVRQAKEFGPNPMQEPQIVSHFATTAISEDCLYLNIWSPAKSMDEKLPVLVYINGGALMCGSGSDPILSGISLARKGIIGVTINYREGVFGFIAHPELSAESPYKGSGNYGFLDQVAALQWLHTNIAAFGGDPERVTIVGESAGGLSVCALMASPLARGLFSQAMASSGSILGKEPINTLAQGEQLGVKVMETVGCQSLAEMRALPAEELLKRASGHGFIHYYNIDKRFLSEQPINIFEEGRQAKVPLLIGGNSMEIAPKDVFANAYKEKRLPRMEEAQAIAKQLFGDAADEMLQLYGIRTEADLIAQPGRAFCNDFMISFGTWRFADVHRRTGGSPIYRYFYSHPLPETSTPEPSEFPHFRGAVHGADIPYAMGTLTENLRMPWTTEDYFVSATFHAYYVNFIRTGDPNGLGLREWPVSDATHDPYVLQLDLQTSVKQDPQEEKRYKRMNELFPCGR